MKKLATELAVYDIIYLPRKRDYLQIRWVGIANNPELGREIVLLVVDNCKQIQLEKTDLVEVINDAPRLSPDAPILSQKTNPTTTNPKNNEILLKIITLLKGVSNI